MKLSPLFAVPVLMLSTAALTQAQTASAPFQISQKTEAPGVTLSPGSYTVRIADHLNDRIIVQMQKNGSHDVATLLAYPNPSLSGTGSGPVLFATGLKSKPTLRGFTFAGGPAVEFVYPKKDAVTLAKANSVKVMAVDPASEGRPKLPQLTQSDMNEVTLWMLTPTAVQPGAAPGIQAARYTPPTASPAPTDVASAAPQPAYKPAAPAAQPAYKAAAPVSQPAYKAPAPVYSATTSQPAPPAPVQMASNVRPHIRPAVKQLPHTASNLPLIALFGALSFGLAGGLNVNRRLKAKA